jgi:hypothetical protein
MDEFLKARGYPHVIFISPTRQQVLGERPLDLPVKAALARHGIAAVYLIDKPRLRAATAEQKRSWYQDNDHLTKKGHTVWGELMREELARVLPGGDARSASLGYLNVTKQQAKARP